MKTSKKLTLAFLASTLFSFSSVFAAWIDHFEVNFTPNTADVGEAIDLTIEAVDKNNTVITDYEWTILIFSESDPEAELPSALEENTYTYSLSDEWVIKFENAVKFKNSWTQNIHIYDLNDDTVFWIAEAEISEAVVVQNIDIEIISPESGLTIWENKIWISWTTQKNHQVKIILNNVDEIPTTSNETWIFEVEVNNLTDWDNVIKAQVLDADWNVIWESKETSIRVDIDNLNIKNIKVTPESVDPENSFEVEIVANPKLDSVQIILNDVLTTLEETNDWVYSAKIYAPKESGIYKIDVKVTDELGHEKTEIWSSSITVNEVELAAAEETVVEEVTPVVIEETSTEVDENAKKELKIKWLKLVELKTKSILSWDEVEWAESYNIYKKISDWELELITNVKNTTFEVVMWNEKETYDYFAVKAVSKTASWEIYEWSLSDATKVKTGPEILILFLLSLFIWWLVLVIKQKNA
jgi:hypothetical protein